MDTLELIPISALQHYLYCPRQCALIHLEQVWIESSRTAEGRLLHAKTDIPKSERRQGVRTVTALPLVEETLGIVGVADVVEFHGDNAFPVEYKRGRPKAHRADEVQLCAQALCLEAMLQQDIAEGALYYGEVRRRTGVTFDEDLRQLTRTTIESVRLMLTEGRTPSACYATKLCDCCSLLDACQPKLLHRGQSVQQWLAKQLED